MILEDLVFICDFLPVQKGFPHPGDWWHKYIKLCRLGHNKSRLVSVV